VTYKVGLTGGIASGKSTVANEFCKLGIAVFNADKIGHQLMRKGQSAYQEIIKQFGTGILQAAGEIDRAHLGDIVFNDKTLKHRLEGILHPQIMRAMHQKADAVQAPYVILDIPLLIGTPEQSRMDRILVVDCNQETRIRRIKYRNGWSEAKIDAVVSAQISAQQLRQAADDIIDNSGDDLAAIKEQVADLHIQYLAYSKLANDKSE